ncbi:MAG: hypothetical protein MUF42_16200 [Cytophagaceae bacterium]|jgi:hypothetical protein|nr:hypothetical protein [Cytophagaceae bacterium]
MNKVLILVDADVIIHLFKAERISMLNELFPGRLRMLDIVLTELRNNRTIAPVVDNLFQFKQMEEIVFPTNQQALFQEYVSLQKKIGGKGESASLVYCKHFQNILASSNTKDIVPYCKEHGIAYLTTLDIFCIALHRNRITEVEVNAAIDSIFRKGSFLCCKNIAHHLQHHFDSVKYGY